MTIAYSCTFLDRIAGTNCLPSFIDFLPLISLLIVLFIVFNHYTSFLDISRRYSIVIVLAALLIGLPPVFISETQSTGPPPRHAELNSVWCSTHIGNGGTGAIMMDIANLGTDALAIGTATLTVEMPDGTVNDTLSHRNINITEDGVMRTEDVTLLRTGGGTQWPQPGSFAVYQFNASNKVRLESDLPYAVTLSFTDGEEVTGTCVAQPSRAG